MEVMDLILPYKIGDLAESKTFEKGYRGAWFRCKINDMRVTDSGHLECYLEYIDYSKDDKEWIKLFQKNPSCSERQSREEIMIRPSFPLWYWKDQVPEQLPNNDAIGIVDGTWKLGDTVDWLSDDCYWSGKITRLLNENMVQVKLLQPPRGEGKCYEANLNDLRPTLDWSLEGGWTIPLSRAKGKRRHVVRIIHSKSADSETSDSGEVRSSDDGEKGDNGADDNDRQHVQVHVISSNTSQKAPGSPFQKPSSAAKSMSSLNAQKENTLICTVDKPNSSSKSRAPNHGQQTAVTSNEPGMGSSIKQDQAGNLQDQFLQELDKVRGKVSELLECTESMMEHEPALLDSRHWDSPN